VDRLRDQGMMPMQVAAAGSRAAPATAASPPRAGSAARRRWFASKTVNRDS